MQNKNKKEKDVKIIPLGDRVLVDPVGEEHEAEKKTASGIYIPEKEHSEKPAEGTVVAVGEGKYHDGKLTPIKVKVGDKIVFQKYGHDDVKVGEKKYYIMKEENILAIIK